MLNFITKLDNNLTLIIYGFMPHNLFFNSFFSFFSQRGASIFIWAITAGLVLIFEGKRHQNFIIYFVIIFLLSYISSEFIVKNIVARPRPVSNNCPSDYSFPSTHVATAFASATVLAFFHKKRGVVFYFLAVIISLSRIYLSCHFFFDTVAGGLLGYLIAKFILRTKIPIIMKRHLLK